MLRSCMIPISFVITVLAFAQFTAAASGLADAVMQRDKVAVRSLLQQQADVNLPQTDGTTALHWAARWDDLETAGTLIRQGARAGFANRAGATPLFLAALNGSAAMIDLLLRAGVDANAPVLPHGMSALMIAARTGKVEAAKVVVEHGAHVNAIEDLRGTTALMTAAEHGHAVVVEYLASHGADVHMRSKVLTPVLRSGLGYARVDKEGKLPRDTVGGVTALIIAAREGHLDSVRALVAAGADISQTSVDGTSPLLVAVQNGEYDIARYLLDRAADPNQGNEKGWTPLYLAIGNRNKLLTALPGPSTDGAMDFIQLLLDRGANPNVQIKVKTEIHQANHALWLFEEGATPVLRAAMAGDIEVVRLLVSHGADPLITTFDHTTPLMVASGVGWADGLTQEYSEEETLETVKFLVEHGANVTDANDHGITALHGAAFKGASKVVQYLVDRGADLAAKDKGETDFGLGDRTVPLTPLMWAEGISVGMSSAIYRTDTVALLVRLMNDRGIPVVHNTTFPGHESLEAK